MIAPAQFVIWPLEQDILTCVSQLFDELLVYIHKLKGFRPSSKQLKTFVPCKQKQNKAKQNKRQLFYIRE